MTRTLTACAAALLCAVAAPAFAKPDRAFLKDALQGDNSEMTLGRLAARRGVSPGVREFGRMLAMDHAKARAEAAAVARRAGAPVTSAMAPEAIAERRKLQRLSGRAFDREFARYMVDDHRKDIREFEEQAAGHGPTARLAEATLPALRKHLETAQSLTR